MLSELTKKGILTIKSLLDECKVGIEQTNKELEVIDEKYRKIIAEEKKTLKCNLAEYKTQLKQYEKMFSTFDTTAVKEALGDFESTATENPEDTVETVSTAEESEGTVFDSVYPENNAGEEEKEKEKEKEPVPVLVEKEIDEEENGHQESVDNGKMDDADSSDEWPLTHEDATPAQSVDNDDWPDYPDDWK